MICSPAHAGMVALTLLLAGCAKPSGGNRQGLIVGHQPDGSVLLSDFDKNLNCDRLGSAIRQRIANMAVLAKAENKARHGMPPTLLTAISWSTGSRFADSSYLKRYRWLRAETDAYHALMIKQKCPPLNLAALYTAVAIKKAGDNRAEGNNAVTMANERPRWGTAQIRPASGAR